MLTGSAVPAPTRSQLATGLRNETGDGALRLLVLLVPMGLVFLLLRYLQAR